jgi:hypothetical protein
MKVLQIIVTVVGVLVALLGIVWFLQGINVLPGSFMSGQSQWAINGSIAFVLGVALVAGANWDRIRSK